MGITSPLHGYPAEGLGGLTNGVSPLEMARAYATIANGGYRVKPIVVRKVTFPDGHVDDLGKPTKHQGLRGRRDLRGHADPREERAGAAPGTERPRSAAPRPARPARSTTSPTPGSSASRRGWSPRSGSATRRTPIRSVPDAQGGAIAAPIWGAYMKSARGKFCGDFPKPKVPFSAQPFFGKYSRTGGKARARPSDQPRTATAGATGQPGDAARHGNGAGHRQGRRRQAVPARRLRGAAAAGAEHRSSRRRPPPPAADRRRPRQARDGAAPTPG